MYSGPPAATHRADPWEAEHPTELLAAYALGALPPEERGPVAAHLRTCTACRTDLAYLQRAADSLGLSQPPAIPPASARARLMERVAADRQHAHELTAPAPVAQTQQRPSHAPASPWLSWGGWATAAASLAVAAMSTWQLTGAMRETDALRRELAALRADVASLRSTTQEVSATLADIDPADTHVAAIQGAGQAQRAHGRLLYEPGKQSGFVVMEDLPALDPGKVYQLWLMQGSTPFSAGTFSPGPGGAGSVVIRAPAQLGSYALFGITAEPNPGVLAPTGPILASAPLT